MDKDEFRDVSEPSRLDNMWADISHDAKYALGFVGVCSVGSWLWLRKMPAFDDLWITSVILFLVLRVTSMQRRIQQLAERVVSRERFEQKIGQLEERIDRQTKMIMPLDS